jgi:hypothetical protein
MPMKTDLSAVLAKLRAKRGSDRKTFGIYLSKSVLEDFKELCEKQELSYSSVIEAWMEMVLAESKDKKRGK